MSRPMLVGILVAALALGQNLAVWRWGERVAGEVVERRPVSCRIRLGDGREFDLRSRTCGEPERRYIVFAGNLRIDNWFGNHGGLTLTILLGCTIASYRVARTTRVPGRPPSGMRR